MTSTSVSDPADESPGAALSQAPSPSVQPYAPPRMQAPGAARQAFLWGFQTAVAQGARSISCVSTRFDNWWPLDDAELLATLVPWLRLPQRRLLLLAADYGNIGQRLPRFEQWRRDWVHAVPAWRCHEELAAGLPEAFFDDTRTSVQLFDAETGRGRASLEARHRVLLAQQTDVVLQRSEPAWASKTLGL